MGFLIQSTKTELKIFRDNSIQPFFEIPKALVSKRMLESLAQAYDVEEQAEQTSERASESVSESGESPSTDTSTNEKIEEPTTEPETQTKPEITEIRTSKKRKTK